MGLILAINEAAGILRRGIGTWGETGEGKIGYVYILEKDIYEGAARPEDIPFFFSIRGQLQQRKTGGNSEKKKKKKEENQERAGFHEFSLHCDIFLYFIF